MRHIGTAALALLISAYCQFSIAQESTQSLQGLQELLNNSGFPVGDADGLWGGKTREAANGFAVHYKLPWAPLDKPPSEDELANLLVEAHAAVEADYNLYPTQPLESDTYFAGISNQWYYNIHTWSDEALVNKDGKAARVPVERYFQPIDDDAKAFSDAGMKVVREQLGVEGALFYGDCNYRNLDPVEECYVEAFARAKADGWKAQRAALEHLADNPVVAGFVEAVRFWNDRGFQVIVVPSDFFGVAGHRFSGEDTSSLDTLLHAVFTTDAGFRAFLPDFIGGVVAELRKEGLNNIVVQSLNEPRYCPRQNPTRNGLARWQAEERRIFDAVRRVAPKISLISSAICTAGVLEIENDPTLEHVERIVPLHRELDGVTYAMHIYNPGLLFAARASQSEAYRDDLVVRYPYQKVAASMAADDGGKWAIDLYNKVKPDNVYIEKRFANIAAFAARENVKMMITEVGVAKPTFGIPREDRIALLGDLVGTSKKYGIPLMYSAPYDKFGLSSCAHDVDMADHRLDPSLLAIFAYANGVQGAVSDPAPSILEETCGKPVKFLTQVWDNQEASTIVDYLLATSLAGSNTENIFNVRGIYSGKLGNILGLELIFHGNELSNGASEGLKACGNVPPIVEWDSNPPFLVVGFVITGAVLKAKDADCLTKNVPAPLAERVRQIVNNLPKIAEDMATTGAAGDAGPKLREWLANLAEGKVVVEAVN